MNSGNFNGLRILELLENHRSIRKFQDKVIPDEEIKKIISAAQTASSSSNGQAYSIINITNQQTREKLMGYAGGQRHILDCSHFFVFCADLHRIENIAKLSNVDMTESLESTEMFIIATVDAALFAQNTAIAAEALGYGIVYTGGIRNSPELVTEILHLPTRTYPVFGMCIGYPDNNDIPGKKPRLPIESLFFENEYIHFEETIEYIDEYDQTMKDYYANREQNKSKRNWSETITDKRKVPRRLNMKSFLNDQKFLLK
ncbi:oxygen-insensitive NADPH nitroreductase [Psychrobacillus sp. NPDC093180]|uniref:oxygen-insensitive NADPH nitroreductase n=1 Tax=Psychrobacillus sp. NPDC093180 TaxID=3364489 RepID=UPI00380A3641